MLHITNNDVTCQLNIQVKHIVQIYHFKQNIKHDDTCDIHDFQLYIKCKAVSNPIWMSATKCYYTETNRHFFK